MKEDGPAARLLQRIQSQLAFHRWIRNAERKPLEDLGISPDLVPRRKRGQPPKLRITDEQVVQLVWKRQLQEGKPFSNKANRKENNWCFTLVADSQRVEVGTIIAAWKRVPAARRQEIKDWLYRLLEREGKLHARHTNSE